MICRAVVSVVLLLLLAIPASAVDTLRTVAEMGRQVFKNLNLADTTLGTVRMDTSMVRRVVRDQVRVVTNHVGIPKSKALTMVNGTKTYLLDRLAIRLDAAVVKKGNFVYPLTVGDYETFFQSYATMLNPQDTVLQYIVPLGDSVEFYPIPRATMTVEVKYWSRAPNYTVDTNIIVVPEEMYDAIEYRATALAAKKLDRENDYKAWMELYLAEEMYLRGLSDDKGKIEK